jgi:hypothetical protein
LFWQNQKVDRLTGALIATTRLSDIIMRDTNTTNMWASVFRVPTPNPHRKTALPPQR